MRRLGWVFRLKFVPESSMSKQFAVALLALTCSGVGLLAQDSAALVVTVTDPTDAVVPGASVTLVNIHRGTIGHDETKTAGYVAFNSLAPGDYSLEVEKRGFRKYRVDQVTLNVRDRQTLRVELQVAAVNDSRIEVTDKIEALSSDAAQGTSLDQRYIQNLPVNGRSPEALLLMTPGVSTAAGGKGDGGINANGLRSNTNYYTLDGVSMNRSLGGGGGGPGPGGPGGGGPPGGAPPGAGSATEMLSIDGMQEIKVQTSSFAPEFGRSPGAQVVMTSRAGDNDWHGSAFYYLRNEKLDANDWFANSGGYPRGKERQKRPGGTLGGSLKKNKTFFFLSFEKLQLIAPYSVIASVPDLASRQSASAALRPFLNAFPIPNSVSLSNGAAQYRAVVSNPSNSDTESVRLDHLFSPHTTLFLRYSLAPSNSERRGSDVVTPNVLTRQDSRSQTYTGGFTRMFSGSTVNDLRVNYSKSSSRSHSTMDDFGGATPLTDSQVFPKGITSANGSFSLNMIGLAGYSYGSQSSNQQEQINVVDSLTKVVGSHHLKAGLDYRRTLVTNFRTPYSESASFDGLSGYTYSFLSGKALNGQVSSSVSTVYPTYDNFSLYGQDTWRATDRTTLTYGLRWDVNPAPTARSGAKPFALSSSTIAGVTQNDPMYPTRWKNFAPRVGLAYQIDTTQGREMVFRAGFGVFYDVGYGVSTGAFNGAPYSNVRTNSEVLFPFSTANLAPPVLPPTRPYGQITTADSTLSSPVVYQTSATVEKYFGKGQMLSVGYVGTSGKSLLRTENQPAYSDAYDVLNLATNGATSSYHGLQIQFRKRLSDSLQTQLSYTWAHSLDSASNDAGFGGGFASLFGGGQRGSSDYDIRHNLNFSGSYRLPAPKRGLVTSPIRNWYLDFVATARTGLPFDIQGVSTASSASTSTTTSTSTSSNATVGLFAQVRPDYNGLPVWISDPHVPGGRRLNLAAFTIPDGYAQGNLGRNSLRGFPSSQLDLSLRRVIPITERWRFSIAAEGFNILNHPNFANPSPFEGANMSSANFGIVTRMVNQSFGGGVNSLYRSGGSRSMELALRLQF